MKGKYVLENGALKTSPTQKNTKLKKTNIDIGKSMIDEKERQRRLTAWEQSVANFALEDIHPTEDIKRIGFMYINGEITLEEQSKMMRASILTGK